MAKLYKNTEVCIYIHVECIVLLSIYYSFQIAENLEEDASDNLVIDEDVRSPESGNSNSRCGSMSPTNNTSTATTVGIGNGETEESDPLRINSVDSPSSPQSDKMTIDEGKIVYFYLQVFIFAKKPCAYFSLIKYLHNLPRFIA